MTIIKGHAQPLSVSYTGHSAEGNQEPSSHGTISPPMSEKVSRKVIRAFVSDFLHQYRSWTSNVTTLIAALCTQFTTRQLGKLHHYGDCLKFLRTQINDDVHLSKVEERETLVTWAPDGIMQFLQQYLYVHAGSTAVGSALAAAMNRKFETSEFRAYTLLPFLKQYPDYFTLRWDKPNADWTVMWTPFSPFCCQEVAKSIAKIAWDCAQQWYPPPSPDSAEPRNSKPKLKFSTSLDLTDLIEAIFPASLFPPDTLLALLESQQTKECDAVVDADGSTFRRVYELSWYSQFTPYTPMKWSLGKVWLNLQIYCYLVLPGDPVQASSLNS